MLGAALGAEGAAVVAADRSDAPDAAVPGDVAGVGALDVGALGGSGHSTLTVALDVVAPGAAVGVEAVVADCAGTPDVAVLDDPGVAGAFDVDARGGSGHSTLTSGLDAEGAAAVGGDCAGTPDADEGDGAAACGVGGAVELGGTGDGAAAVAFEVVGAAGGAAVVAGGLAGAWGFKFGAAAGRCIEGRESGAAFAVAEGGALEVGAATRGVAGVEPGGAAPFAPPAGVGKPSDICLVVVDCGSLVAAAVARCAVLDTAGPLIAAETLAADEIGLAPEAAVDAGGVPEPRGVADPATADEAAGADGAPEPRAAIDPSAAVVEPGADETAGADDAPELRAATGPSVTADEPGAIDGPGVRDAVDPSDGAEGLVGSDEVGVGERLEARETGGASIAIVDVTGPAADVASDATDTLLAAPPPFGAPAPFAAPATCAETPPPPIAPGRAVPADCRYPSSNPCQSASLKFSGGSLYVIFSIERRKRTRFPSHQSPGFSNRPRSKSTR